MRIEIYDSKIKFYKQLNGIILVKLEAKLLISLKLYFLLHLFFVFEIINYSNAFYLSVFLILRQEFQ